MNNAIEIGIEKNLIVLMPTGTAVIYKRIYTVAMSLAENNIKNDFRKENLGADTDLKTEKGEKREKNTLNK